MIYIQKDTINLVALELSQTLATCTSCSYLFELVYEETTEGRTRYFTAPDISPARLRYNLFAVSESVVGSTGSFVSGAIRFDSGQYDYTVYVTGSTTINFNNLTNILATDPISTGRMVVSGTGSLYPVATPTFIPTASVYS